MKQMYAITMSTGFYDDYNREVIFVTDDFEKGTSYVNENNTIFQSLEKKMSDFYSTELVQWKKDNPRPELGGFNLHHVPKWKGDEVITKEMRDERKALNEKNNLIIQKANDPKNKWHQNYITFVEDWLKTNLKEDQYEMNKTRNDNQWSIDPVKWL